MSSSLNFVLYTPWVVFQMDIYMLLLIIFILIFFQIPGDRTDRQIAVRYSVLTLCHNTS